jgi:hypothetical protein
MANTIKGRVYQILPIERTERNGNTYTKRSVILNCTRFDQNTGEPYPNFPSIEFNGKMIDEIRSINVDDRVEVSFSLNGRFYTNAQNEEKHFTSIRGFKIEVIKSEQPAKPSGDHLPMPTKEPDFLPEPADSEDPF